MTKPTSSHENSETGPVSNTAEHDRVVRVLVGGDLCPIGRPGLSLAKGCVTEVWGGLRRLAHDHDIAVANLECPLTKAHRRIRKAGPHLSSDPAWAAAIRSAGFTVLCLANNHIMDFGAEGLAETLEACGRARIVTVGAGMDLEHARRPRMLEVAGKRIAFLAFAEPEFSIAARNQAGASPLDPIGNYYDIRRAKADSDVVLVILHGGAEQYELPSPQMVATCRFFATAGADAVVCSHSHVPGGFEYHDGVPIVYGTGNLLFDWPSPLYDGWYSGFLVSLAFAQQGRCKLEILPYQQCREEPAIRLLEGNEAALAMNNIRRLSAQIADGRSLEESWHRFCESQRTSYLSSLLSGNRLTNALRARGVLPIVLAETRRVQLLDLIRYPTHRDALVEILSQSRTKGTL